MRNTFISQFDDLLQAQILYIEGFYKPEELIDFLTKQTSLSTKWLIQAKKAKFITNSLLEWLINNHLPHKIALIVSKEFFNKDKLQLYNQALPSNRRLFNNVLEARAWLYN